ncbi:MAG: ATP-binding protein [Candidatus Cloacimonetes bacterium]|nr:ATP-binding protein [Candidatus Cloacimonadota bacterium]
MSPAEFPVPQALLELAIRLADGQQSLDPLDFPPDGPPTRPRRDRARKGRSRIPTSPFKAELDTLRSRLDAGGYSMTRELQDEDLQMLALLFAAWIEGDGSQRVLCLVRAIRPEGTGRLGLLERLEVMQTLRLLSRDEKRRPGLPGAPIAPGRLDLVEGWIGLHPAFLRRLLQGDGRACITEPADLPVDNERFLADLVDYGQFLHESGGEGVPESDTRSGREQAWSRLEEKARLSQEPLPFLELVRECGLEPVERDLLVYMLEENLRGMDCSIEELCAVLGTNPLDQIRQRRLFQSGSRLLTHQLITVGARGRFGRFPNRVALTARALERIMGQGADAEPREANLLAGSELLKERPVIRRWDQLVLPADTLEGLDSLLRRFENGTRERLARWGVWSEVQSLGDGLASKGALPVSNGLRLLLSGPSGTGKTLCAEALAQRLDRRLLVTDVGRLLSKWVGESQQNVSALFDDYERIVASTEKAPVLLLDECDQFLLQRGHPDSGSDQMRHEMLNLFLERLERVPGIVVATTNLVEVLDSAFNRRFDLKLVFHEPGPAEREHIWRQHLPAAVPLLEPIPFAELARRFVFNGGQIALVMHGALLAAATRGDGLLTQDLLDAAHLEERGRFDAAAPGDWGFRAG